MQGNDTVSGVSSVCTRAPSKRKRTLSIFLPCRSQKALINFSSLVFRLILKNTSLLLSVTLMFRCSAPCAGSALPLLLSDIGKVSVWLTTLFRTEVSDQLPGRVGVDCNGTELAYWKAVAMRGCKSGWCCGCRCEVGRVAMEAIRGRVGCNLVGLWEISWSLRGRNNPRDTDVSLLFARFEI